MLQNVLKKRSEGPSAPATCGGPGRGLPGFEAESLFGGPAEPDGVLFTPHAKREAIAALRQRMKEIAQTRVRYGFWRIHILLRRHGFTDNHKRTYRIYKEEGLNLRSKRPGKSRAAAHRLERFEPKAPSDSF